MCTLKELQTVPYSDFLTALQTAGTCRNQAILYENHHLKVLPKISIKTNNINTWKIALLARRALQQISLDTCALSYETRAENVKKLREGLEGYQCRVFQSKAKFKKLLHHVGMRSLAEWVIALVIYSAAKKEKVLRSQIQQCSNGLGLSLAHYNAIFKEGPAMEVNIISAACLNSSALKLEKGLEGGMSMLTAAHWLTGHLKNFKEKVLMPGKRLPEANEMDEMQKASDDNLKYAAAQYRKNVLEKIIPGRLPLHKNMMSAVFPKWYERKYSVVCPTGLDYYDFLRSECIEKIRKLRIGEFMMLQGGYKQHLDPQTKQVMPVGHAIAMDIERESEKYFKITFINTGEGSRLTEETQKMVRNAQASNMRHKDLKVVDNVYSGIPYEAMTNSFLFQLLFHREKPVPTNMRRIEEGLQANLNRFPSFKFKEGRVHTRQRKGNCGIKSLTAWLKNHLSPHLYREFKVYYTEIAVRKLEENPQAYSKSLDRATYDNILRECKQILAKRTQKHRTAALLWGAPS